MFIQPLQLALQVSESNDPNSNGEYLSRSDHCNAIIDLTVKKYIIPQMAKDTEHWLVS